MAAWSLVRALERLVTALVPLMTSARRLPGGVMRSGPLATAVVELLSTRNGMRVGTMRVLSSIALSVAPWIRLLLLVTACVSRALAMTATVRFSVRGRCRTAPAMRPARALALRVL